jgi:speckle-type POZ protein
MGVGKFVSSSKFSVEGYDWKIRFYPDGWREEEKGNIYPSSWFSAED